MIFYYFHSHLLFICSLMLKYICVLRILFVTLHCYNKKMGENILINQIKLLLLQRFCNFVIMNDLAMYVCRINIASKHSYYKCLFSLDLIDLQLLYQKFSKYSKLIISNKNLVWQLCKTNLAVFAFSVLSCRSVEKAQNYRLSRKIII
jgi:hypothetical protein